MSYTICIYKLVCPYRSYSSSQFYNPVKFNKGCIFYEHPEWYRGAKLKDDTSLKCKDGYNDMEAL